MPLSVIQMGSSSVVERLGGERSLWQGLFFPREVSTPAVSGSVFSLEL